MQSALRGMAGQAALAELAASPLRPDGATAYMCAEADWRDCHRQVIAQKLMEDFGLATLHIKRDGSLEEHPRRHVLPAHYLGTSAASFASAAFAAGAAAGGPECCVDGHDSSSALRPSGAEAGEPPPPPQQQPKARRWGKKA
mmetsp:Transcript_18130/g.58768  ORF Transcript_18130/g.58768 Transcript_18130/m.58768 type:complete len:142 (-) Transcript_18130:29-454(-)